MGDTMNLSPEEFSNLLQEKFEFRYTDKDADYMSTLQRQNPQPPVVCPWKSRQERSSDNRWEQRDRSGRKRTWDDGDHGTHSERFSWDDRRSTDRRPNDRRSNYRPDYRRSDGFNGSGYRN